MANKLYLKKLNIAILILPLLIIGCGGNTPSSPVDNTPSEEIPPEETPSEETSPEETPPEETPPEETPPEETPPEETPPEETPPEETPPEETPVMKTITVIDGYLHNASICIDRNSNSSCEVDEKLLLTTNELGQIEVDTADAVFPIIAQAEAGVTVDSDQQAPLSHSYELIAPANADYITPFTTLAYLNNISLQALAEQYNINASAISGDYVSDQLDQSQLAHLIARSITPFLTPQLANNDIAELKTTVKKITELALNELANATNLSTINISYNSQLARFYSKPKATTLSSYLEDHSFVYTRFSNHSALDLWPEDDITFNNGIISYINTNEAYTIAKNTLSYGSLSYSFLIMNDNYFLSFSEDNNLGMWTNGSIWNYPTIAIENDFVAGKTLYHLRDINGTLGQDVATPILTKLEFGDENTVTVTPEGEPGFVANWEVSDWTDGDNNTYRTLYIEFPESEQNRASLRREDAMLLAMKLITNKVSVATNHYTMAEVPENLIIADEALARLMYRTWLNDVITNSH